jgi:hypothetical protein
MPDQPALSGGSGMFDAKNVIPAAQGFRPLPALTAYTNALTARCQGAFSTKDKSGTSHAYAGDATKLYLLSTATWSDASRLAGGAYACPADSQWRFAKFGGNCIAVNGSDVMQTISMAAGANFAALAGSPPAGPKFIAVVREFVVVANLTSAKSTVQWSGSDDSTVWSGGESDAQEIYEGGIIQGLVGGEVGYVFLERAIVRMVRAPAPLSFQFDTVEQGRGVLAPYSITSVGSGVFYLGQDGFYLFNGAQSVPIGADQVDRTFFAELNATYFDRVSAATDPVNKLVFVVYPAGSGQGSPNKCLIWNWGVSPARWSYASFDSEVLMQLFAQGVGLDSLDSYSSSLDALTFSLDAAVWQGGQLSLAAFDTSHKLGFFTGSNLAATMTTQEAQVSDTGRAFVSEVTPLIDCTDATVSIGARERQGGSVTFGSESSIQSTGICPVRSSGRFHRARVSVPAASTWTYAQGVDVVKARGDGVR